MTDWENLFKPSDVAGIMVRPHEIYGWYNMSEDRRCEAMDKAISCRINAILKKHLSEAPEVYAHEDDRQIFGTVWTARPHESVVRTHHKARLVAIEKIKG